MDEALTNATYQALAFQRNSALDQAASLSAQVSVIAARNVELEKSLAATTKERDELKAKVDELSPPVQQA